MNENKIKYMFGIIYWLESFFLYLLKLIASGLVVRTNNARCKKEKNHILNMDNRWKKNVLRYWKHMFYIKVALNGIQNLTVMLQVDAFVIHKKHYYL